MSAIAGIRTRFQRLGHSARSSAGQDRGYALIEVIVSGLLLVIASGGILGAINAAGHATGEERNRSRASDIAQDDLSRMRAMRVSDLSNLHQTRTVTKDGTPYTVVSHSEFLSDSTGTASCDAGTASADYIKIDSTVTWPSMGTRPAVYAASLVAPPNGSISANSGSLAVSVEDASATGLAGIGVSGSGAGSFSGSTGDNGCVVFGDLPAGSYTLNVSGIAAGLVDPDGNPPAPITASVVGESTNTVVFQYDQPSSIPVTFKTKNTTGTTVSLINSTADVITAFNTGMTVPRRFGTLGTRVSTLTATSLFPFVSPYSVYAGNCDVNNPNPDDDDTAPGALASASVTVPPGSSSSGVIQLPALNVVVYQGSNTSSAKAAGATVKVRDVTCGNQLRTYTTNATGQLPDQGLPYSTEYSVCASATITGTIRRRTTTGLSGNLKDPAVIDPVNPVTLNMFLTGGGSTSGAACP